MKAQALLRILMRSPLSYSETRRSGSHRRLKATGRPPITWAYHDGRTLSPREVRRVLVDQVGLDESEALALL
ncbi:MAG: type II toxin-antitoxin system HicA family toxin [Solirubrobacteraceae bacterium]